jgi:lysine biosynthesis protein LysW
MELCDQTNRVLRQRCCRAFLLSIHGNSHAAITQQIRRSDMASTQCSECDEEIEVAGRVRLGQKVACNHCGAALEVVVIEPLELEIAQEEEDDLWDEAEIDVDEIDEDELDEDEIEDDELDEVVLTAPLEDDGDEVDDFDDDFDDDELDDDELDDDFDDYDDFDDDDFDDELDDGEDDDARWT